MDDLRTKTFASVVVERSVCRLENAHLLVEVTAKDLQDVAGLPVDWKRVGELGDELMTITASLRASIDASALDLTDSAKAAIRTNSVPGITS